MTYLELYNALDHVDHSRAKRMGMSKLLASNPSCVATLLEIAFQVDDPVSCKASWVLEFMLRNI